MAISSIKRSRKVQIILNDSLNHQLNQAARRSGITKSAFVRVALEREFAYDQRLELECSRSTSSPEKTTRADRHQSRLFEI